MLYISVTLLALTLLNVRGVRQGALAVVLLAIGKLVPGGVAVPGLAASLCLLLLAGCTRPQLLATATAVGVGALLYFVALTRLEKRPGGMGAPR